ncbi:MAG: Crp/Fnr family transcriptional regulator [Alphaproteobacteria bacterium]
MQHGAVAELLARSPMLCGLGSELLSAIILRGDMVRYSAGQPVTLAGTPADSALYILEGRVSLPEQGADDIMPSLEPGAGLSEMAMFVETDHYHNTIALEDVVALQISRELMGHLVFERPVLAECFATNIRNTLANITRQLNELDEMLDESSLPEPEFEPDTVVEEFEFQPPPAVVSESADTMRDLQLPDLSLPDLSLPELTLDGFGENGLEVSGPEENLFETAHIEDNEGAPVRDIMVELSQFSLRSSQTPPELEHDRTVFPSLAPRRSREETGPSVSGQASPIYGLAGGPGSSFASHAPGNSTR